MEVLLASEYGFCVGVKRALKKLSDTALSVKDKPVYSIGEIIHNQDVISEFRARGVQIVEKIGDAVGGVGVVRAHGLPHSVIQSAESQGQVIIDATCPFVRNISNIIEREIKEGSRIFLVGEPNHPEVIAATFDYAEHVQVIDHQTFDPDKFHYPAGKAALLSQTTMSEKTFEEIAAHFIRRCQHVHVHNTICPSSKNRQSAALETAGLVDFMVILGGKNSSNTRRLYDVCSQIVPSFHVGRISELDVSKVAGLHKAGLTAGASTPDWIVEEAVEFLKKL